MDWKDSLRTAIKKKRELEDFLEVSLPDLDYPILIPLRLAQKIKKAGPDSPLWKQFVPSQEENLSDGLEDPIADALHSPTPMIVHRYHNRCLFLPTSRCPVICRYCFRKNELYSSHQAFGQETKKAMDYLRSHPEIEEVIFSGGDPLILSNEKLDFYLNEISQIQSVDFIRFHSRTPVILPERVDDRLIKVLKKYQERFLRVTLVIHCNHAQELDAEVQSACKKLKSAGVYLLSQSVLLKGVNDTKEDQLTLYRELIKSHISPYYLHHPDNAKGAQHFRLCLEEGRQLVASLRDRLPGWALPRYTIELPEGQGKVSAMNSVTSSGLKNLDSSCLD